MSFNSGPRVFVVDNEPMIASTLVTILHTHRYSARAFLSPLEALAAARKKSPDLLRSDAGMPGISGIDLAIQMKVQFPACTVLLLSGPPSGVELLHSVRAQGHDFDLLMNSVPTPDILAKVSKSAGGAEDACIA